MEGKEDFWLSRIKSPFLRAVIAPFFIVFYHLVELFVWFMFIIVASQLGTIFNIIQRCGFKHIDWDVALALDSSAGAFYTFAMVMIASLIGPLFRQFIKEEEPEYRKVSMTFITLLIFTLLFCSVFYAFSSNYSSHYSIEELENAKLGCDWSQLVFFVLAIIFSWYSFGLSLIKEHEDSLLLSDKHLREENQKKLEMDKKLKQQEKATVMNKDGKKVDI